MGETVRYECVDHVATITYHRPEALNAINAELRQDLNATWERFRDDEDAWVGIVTGAGRAFCVGADLKDGRGSVGEWPGSFWEIPTINSFESGLELWKPTIAAVPGYCLGYGLTADDAEFGFPEVGLGVPTIVGAMRLPGRVSWSHAMELLLIGERVGAEAAKDMGLVWRIVPRAALMDEAMTLARRLVAAAPLAQRATKEMAARGAHLPWEDAVRLGESMRRVVGATEDAAEGMLAAREGRAAEWKGR
jgi:enoyl-CoA hydratase/carnithine racemase